MNYEWDPKKAASNLKKHGVHFADAVGVFEDARAITIEGSEYSEQRFVSIGADFTGRVIVVAYTPGATAGRFGLFQPGKHSHTRGRSMKKNYDFSSGSRGCVAPSEANKTRITIRLDSDIIDWFRDRANQQGGGNYQTMINQALRDYIRQEKPLKEMIKEAVREELAQSRAAAS